MNTLFVRVLACVMAVGLFAGSANAVNIETVPVGNPGNAPDIYGAGYGSVAYGESPKMAEVQAIPVILIVHQSRESCRIDTLFQFPFSARKANKKPR